MDNVGTVGVMREVITLDTSQRDPRLFSPGGNGLAPTILTSTNRDNAPYSQDLYMLAHRCVNPEVVLQLECSKRGYRGFATGSGNSMEITATGRS